MATVNLALPTLPGGAEVSRISALSSALSTMNSTTKSACRTCDGLSRRSRHLE